MYSDTGTTNTVIVSDSAGGDAVEVMNLQHKKNKQKSEGSVTQLLTLLFVTVTRYLNVYEPPSKFFI